MSVILTRARSLSAGTNNNNKSVVVSASTTQVVDMVNTVDISSVKWFLTIIDNINIKISAVEVYATHRNGTVPFHTVYAKLGDNIDYTIDVDISGSDLRIRIINNESVAITIKTASVQTIN